MRLALVALVALLLVASPATAQSPAIATVEGSGEIRRAEFDHWLKIAAKSARLKRVPRVGTPRYRDLSDQVMQLLIQNLWVAGEAAQRGVVVTAEDVRREFRSQRRMSFPGPRDFRAFLRQSGFTVADIRYRIRLELLSNRLRRLAIRDAPRPTPEELRAYYDEHLEQFTRPERRGLRLLRTRTRSAARRARSAIAAGTSFDVAARRFGRLVPTRAVRAETELPGRLDRAVFRARKGRLSGPVRAMGSWWVFRVTSIRRERTQIFEQAQGVIRDLLGSERQQAALDAFIDDFQARWRDATTCRVRYATNDCGHETP